MAPATIKRRIAGDETDGWIRKRTPRPAQSTPRHSTSSTGNVPNRRPAKATTLARFKDGERGLHDWTGGTYQRICSGVKWIANVINTDGGDPAHALDIWALHGHRKRIEIPCGLIDQPRELRGYLVKQGMKIERVHDAAHRIADYLSTRPNQPVHIRAIRDGWQKLGDADAYVLGDKAFCASAQALCVSRTPPVDVRQRVGTLAQWTNIVRLCIGNPLLIVALCAAFASALLHPFGRNAFGISLVGRSSTGKTTALRLALALFDSPSNLANWVSTANGLEALAAQYSHMPLVLDEIGLASREVMTDAAYRLTNGPGKLRAARDGSLAPITRISSVSISAGEESVVERIEQGGHQAKLGQIARFLALSSDYEHGAFAKLHGERDGAAFSAKLNQMVQATHGVAWEPFVKYLAKNISAVKKMNVQYQDGVKAHLTEGLEFDPSDGVCARVLDNFALMFRAGKIARLAGVFPVKDMLIANALRQVFRKWFEQYQQRIATPDETILDEVRYLLQKHRHNLPSWSDYSNADRETAIGFTWSLRNRLEVYLIFPGAFDTMKRKHGRDVFNRALISAGWLLPGSGNRPTQQREFTPPARGRTSMYVLSVAAIFNE
ncbi:DUF927 domain-containing protein [Paraburkholderia sediminicola]|uniref:DUF927 domain-containing protein n=1 Tax=Paraburkholderia sediminicola TaxID=458836 RepID=UPI0038BADD82